MARTAASAPGRSGNSRGREKELDSGNPGSARRRDFCNPGQGDAADRQDGSVRRGGDFFQLGNTRGSGSRLRRGRINRAKNQVVHRPHGGRDLSERVNGGADHPSAGRDASQPYRIERITAKVSAMGTCCKRDVGPIVDDHLRRRRRIDHPPSEPGQHAAIEVALAQLNQIDTRSPRFRSLRDEFVELGLRILARCQTMSIGDEADEGEPRKLRGLD